MLRQKLLLKKKETKEREIRCDIIVLARFRIEEGVLLLWGLPSASEGCSYEPT